MIDKNRWETHAMEHLTGSIAVKEKIRAECVKALVDAANCICEAFRSGKKLLICGNGGSAADAQHLAAEFVGTLTRDYERPALPAIALTTDSSILTSVANDFGFDQIFARQVEALGIGGDVLLVLSTSGHSPNVVGAVDTATARGMRTVALLGRDGGKLARLVDYPIVVPSDTTMFIQESHLALYHILVAIVEREIHPRV